MSLKINITDPYGKPIASALSNLLKRIVATLEHDFQSIAPDVMKKSVQEHFASKYPSSQHYSPNKVSIHGDTVQIDVPGASRAYHDITIRPIHAKSLTIPIHQRAYGKKVTDFDKIFRPKGKNVLAINENGSLLFLFALSKSAFQKQDPSIMPSDESMASRISAELIKHLKSI